METPHAKAEKDRPTQRDKRRPETNAERIWETTMDPQKHRQPQVKLEDDLEADNIYTSLMGDLVLPLREFIKQNSFNVHSLDARGAASRNSIPS